jgi:diguanylate cyclase (GGDEF)-like protein/PAS domain S-box-containing protein
MPNQAGVFSELNDSDGTAFLRAVLDAADIGTAVLGGDGNVLFWSSGLERISGLTSVEAEGARLAELLPPGNNGKLAELVASTLADGKPRSVPASALMSLAQSSSNPSVLHGYIRLTDDTGVGSACLLQVVDLSETDPTEHDWVIAMLDAVPDHVCVVDGDGRWLFANRRMRELFALPNKALAGQGVEEVIAATGANRALLSAAFTYTRSAWAIGKQVSREETILNEDGEERLYQFVQIPLYRRDGGRKGMISILRDLTDSRETAARIEFLAHHDSLTRLPNRILFRDRLKSAIALAKRTGDQIGLLIVDLARFREINETLGHDVGDDLLREVGDRLIERVRESDTVARLSADEFGVILTQLKAADGAATAAEGLLQTIDKPFDASVEEITLSACIGISMFPEDSDDPDELLKNADLALSRAKSEGPNHYSFFVAGMNDEVQMRKILENDLRRALAEDQLELYYQPQIDSRTGEICGVESLLRWNHPTRGVLAPGLFIPIAESNGLIMPIGDWILDRAATQAKQWAEEGIFSGTMAVNLSPAQFNNNNVLPIILGSLERSGVDPRMMQIEIVESMAMNDVDATISVLAELRKTGLSISIDDFGTGYSSLNYLKKLPVDKMKIDRSFVVDIGVHPGNEAIITAIVDLGHSLGMKVNVEGIETESQLAFLKQAGVDELQGYLMGRPMPADEIAKLLRDGWDG